MVTLNTALTEGIGVALVELLADQAVGKLFKAGAKFAKITTKCGRVFKITRGMFDRLQIAIKNPAVKEMLIKQLNNAADPVKALRALTKAAKHGGKRWAITVFDATRFSKQFGRLWRDPKTGLWWSKDKAGHGGSAWKVFQENDDGLTLVWAADEFGDRIDGKHESGVGGFLPWKDLSK